ncbi:hypothetical protein C8Q74DRAFT_1248572 [Fomes fomentarius]|nr:hypothetical protein C8Q74DRAFT_1248572 [Fomes fomentarius]
MDVTGPPAASSPGLSPKLPAFDDTLGAWLIGSVLGVLLQGVAYHQTYRYFRLYPRDSPYIKTWVVLLSITETVNTIFVLHTCYYYLVTNYFNVTALFLGPVWSLKLLPVPASLSAVITQTFFARRIYLINRRLRPVAVLAVFLILMFCASFTAFTALGWNKQTMSDFLDLSWLASLASGLIMAADLIMTFVLIWFLRRNHTGVIHTDSILDLLIMYTISSGLIICIFNVLNVAFSLLWPDNLIYTAISVILTKLYSNTFLASLNTRKSLIQERGSIMNEVTPFKSTILRNTGPNARMEIEREDSSTKQISSKDNIELKVVTMLVRDTNSVSDMDMDSPGEEAIAV